MLDVHLRRPPGRGLPGRHLDGHQLLLRRAAGHAARPLPRGARPDHQGMDRAEDAFAFNGKYTKLRYVNLWPKPIQQPHPPIWIPGGGSIETWDFCGRNDYNYSYLSFSGYRRPALIDGYWDALDRRGKESNPYSLGFAQIIAVADTDAEAEREYRPHVDYFFNRCLHVFAGLPRPPAIARSTPSSRASWPGRQADPLASTPAAKRPGRIWSSRATSSPGRPRPCAIV